MYNSAFGLREESDLSSPESVSSESELDDEDNELKECQECFFLDLPFLDL
jgi:hypothetical protein